MDLIVFAELPFTFVNPIGLLTARTPNWLGANGNHHTTWEDPKQLHTRQIHLKIETVQTQFYGQSQVKRGGGFNSIETGWVYLAARENYGRDS